MLAKPSFREELRRYTAKGVANKQIVERWKRRTDADSIWEAISAACPDLGPADIIAAVIRFRARAQSTVNQIYGVTATAPGVVVTIPGINKEWDSVKEKLDSLTRSPGSFDPEAADNIVGKLEELHLRYVAAVDGATLSRKDEGGTRVLRLFWQLIGDYLQTNSGRWFDSEVARLTEIAFNLPRIEPANIAASRNQRTQH